MRFLSLLVTLLSTASSFTSPVHAALSHHTVEHVPLTAKYHNFDLGQARLESNPAYVERQQRRQQLLDLQNKSPNAHFEEEKEKEKEEYLPEAVYVAPIVGCASVDFSASVYIGNEGPFLLIVDTGSTTLAVAAAACTTCTAAGVTPTYSAPAAKLDGAAPGSVVSSSYGDGSGWAGRVYLDTVKIGSATSQVSANLRLAAILQQANDFFGRNGCGDVATARGNTNQGIIGYAFPALAQPPAQGFFDQWVAQNAGSTPTFSIQMCFRKGQLWHGGFDSTSFSTATDAATINSAIHWVKVIKQQWFVINMLDLSLQSSAGGGAAANPTYKSVGVTAQQFNAGGAIVDSGTSIFGMPTAAYNAIAKLLNANTAFVAAFGTNWFDSGYCSQPRNGMTMQQLNAALPRLRVTIGADTQGNNPLYLDLFAAPSYLMPVQFTQNGQTQVLYCPGIAPFPSNTILGYTVMNQFVTVHDNKAGLIGFAPSINCASLASNAQEQQYSGPAGLVSGGVTNADYPATGGGGVPTSAPTAAATTKAPTQPSGGGTTVTLTTTYVQQQHGTTANCWIILNGVVYDMTQFEQSHPGGVNYITSNCGKDGTNAYQAIGAHDPTQLPTAQQTQADSGILFIGRVGQTVTLGGSTTAPTQAPTSAPTSAPTKPPTVTTATPGGTGTSVMITNAVVQVTQPPSTDPNAGSAPAGTVITITINYTPSVATTLFVWMYRQGASAQLPIYLAAFKAVSGGQGVVSWTVPTNGMVPYGGYELHIGQSTREDVVGHFIYQSTLFIGSGMPPNCMIDMCSFHGKCVPTTSSTDMMSTSACVCDSGYWGPSCANWTNPSATATTTSNVACYNGGKVKWNDAKTANECYCAAGFKGADCSMRALTASLTYNYNWDEVKNQLGLLTPILQSDLAAGSGFTLHPDTPGAPTAATYVNINSIKPRQNKGVNASVLVSFALQCSTLTVSGDDYSGRVCTAAFLMQRLQALAVAISTPRSPMRASLSGQYVMYETIGDQEAPGADDPFLSSSQKTTVVIIVVVVVVVVVAAIAAMLYYKRRNLAASFSTSAKTMQGQTGVGMA